MAVTAGSNAKLNTIKGVAKIITVTEAENTSLADKVLPANLLVKKADGKIYLTDGVKTLANIDVLIDQVLVQAEKTALANAFTTGSYAKAAGGVVVHDSDSLIADNELHLIDSADGKLKDSYLKMLGADGKISLDYLPDTVRAHITYVNDIAARDALSTTGEEVKGPVFVIDASADPTVESGWAMYVYEDSKWVKIGEGEGLDPDYSSIECNYENCQKAGAVMYDHTLLVDAPSATELVALQEA